MPADTRSDARMGYNVLGGMHDDTATKCWVRLLRHGVFFRIEATADRVQGTSMHRRWQAIIAEIVSPLCTSPVDRVDRWNQLCDLLIETSLPLLESLAPRDQAPAEGIQHHRVLRDCFHATTYCLHLTKDSASQDVCATVASGPVDESPYGFQTDKVGTFDTSGTGLTEYSSRELSVFGADISTPPRKLQTPDGTVHFFEALMRDSGLLKHVNTRNHSRDVIGAYLQLDKDPGVAGIPSISGTVVHEGAFAGLLLQDLPKAGTLLNRLSTITTIEALEEARSRVTGWQMRIASAVEHLHSRDYAPNDGVSECDVHESSLLVDEQDNIWLKLSYISKLGGERNDELISKDQEAVQRLFELFVPEELARMEVQVESA